MQTSFSVFLLSVLILAGLQFTYAHPPDLVRNPSTTHNSRSPTTPCTSTNLLQNPSFETGSVSSWTEFVTGSWASRGISKDAPHSGAFAFRAVSNSTSSSTLTLAQYEIGAPDSGEMRVGAWVFAAGGVGEMGSVKFTLFAGGRVVGEVVLSARSGWGAWSQIGADVGSESLRAMTVTVVVDAGGVVGEGIVVGVDDLWVGLVC
ncbi:hypothetical protein P280DRAFT_313159 [Massarina eburnea CBS 473.64]|uniref:CBM-cenC domain-containing protein n=1 Tax=Massarina eburnea CBS 473.64 TaxID=1395130 RepID=A0A6A6S0R4_9PLEO|nr:hypothetical protein P280DRAFT_313159 [Massarina eburnea CBS 473.64]